MFQACTTFLLAWNIKGDILKAVLAALFHAMIMNVATLEMEKHVSICNQINK